MFRYRDHRGTLADSLKTTQHLHSVDDIKKHLFRVYGDGEIKVESYGGVDDRCGWDTYIVTHNGNAMGFTDGPVKT